jgi:predicted HAD superfamily phosphohydrolase YqeG
MTSDILQFSTRAAINITAKTERVGKTWIHKEIFIICASNNPQKRHFLVLEALEMDFISPEKPTKSIPQSFMHKFAMTMPGPHFVDDAIILDGPF